MGRYGVVRAAARQEACMVMRIVFPPAVVDPPAVAWSELEKRALCMLFTLTCSAERTGIVGLIASMRSSDQCIRQ